MKDIEDCKNVKTYARTINVDFLLIVHGIPKGTSV